MNLDLARLNHILIPSSRSERDRLRNGRAARLLRPVLWLYERLTPEGQGLSVLVLIVAVMGLDVEGTTTYLLFCPLAGLLLAALAAARAPRFALRGVQLEVRAPARVRPDEVLRFEVTLRNDGPRGYGPVQLAGPFLPWDGRWLGALPTVPSLGPGERRTVLCEARFTARGLHHLDSFRAGALVPLALATGAQVQDAGTKFTVIPRVAPVRALQLAPAAAAQQRGGATRSSRTQGDARDLRGVRPYRPGDKVRDLHARRWARTGTPVVREYQQESDPRVAVLVDLDKRGTTAAQREGVLSLAAGVVVRLCADGNAVALWLNGRAAQLVTLPAGRSPDAALDALGEARGASGFELDRWRAELRSSRAPEHLVLLCALWNDERADFARELALLGCAVTAVWVPKPGERAEASPERSVVSLAALQRGDPLVLP